MSGSPNSSPPERGRAASKGVLRRTVLSLGIALGAGTALTRSTVAPGPGRAAADPNSVTDQPSADPGSVLDAPAQRPGPTMPTKSLATAHGKAVTLTTRMAKPSAPLRRYRNVFMGDPDVTAEFFRTGQGVLKIAASAAGLSGQLQILDAATGVREKQINPFPGNGGGVGATAYDAPSATLFAFGAENIVQRVSSSGTVSTGYSTAKGTTNASFAVATDSKGRIWNGNYPSGNATRFDPASGSTLNTGRLRADTQYVRSLAIDSSDTVYAGTGASNPAIFSWDTDNPGSVREIPLPWRIPTGFVRRIEAHRDLLFVYVVGPDGKTIFSVYRTSTGTWLTPPWKWLPSGMVTASSDDNSEAYAVWSGAGSHRLMRIDTRTLEADYVCLVPGPPEAMEFEASGSQGYLNLLCGSGKGFRVARISLDSGNSVRDVPAELAPRIFKLQTLIAPAGNKVFFGGYLGDGIGSLDLVTRRTWRSAPAAGIRQIEGMLSYNARTLYIGSYTGGVIFRFNPATGSVKKLIELRDKYLQSRPIAWTTAGSRVVAGTIPDYGRSGGALVLIDPADDSTRVIVDPVPGQSILGLVGEGDVVYGTTGIKGGHGAPNDATPAHVFAWNVAQGRMLWKQALPGEVEINSPLLVRGGLYVSTSNGVVQMGKADGTPVATYRLLERWAAAKYRTSSIEALPGSNRIVHLCGGTVTLLDLERKTRTELLRGTYSDLAVGRQNKLLLVDNGTDVVELAVGA